MHIETIDERKEMARARHAYAHDARGRGLQKNWFTAMIALGFGALAVIPMSGLMPQPVWAALLGVLVVAIFAIALFGPRINQQKPQ